MAFNNKKIAWHELIQFNKEGIYVADFTTIRSSIIDRFKTIYGQDIDLSTTSADGIYVENLALMISNILQSYKSFYSQLDVRTASGSFLDALCALSNVYRKLESNSTATVTITLDTSNISDWTTNDVELIDKNGTTWSWSSSTETLTFVRGQAQDVVVTCSMPGPVRADAGWIDRLVENNYVATVVQSKEANLGSYSETDSELRLRRSSSLGSSGSTILETLVGTLLTLSGIDDVKIYNNDSSSTITAQDGTSIHVHSIYAILRLKENMTIADQTICNMLYEKLTPGILTAKSNGKCGIAKSAKYVESSLGVPTTLNVTQNVYWKQATGISPKIEITLTKGLNFASSNNSTANLIVSKLISSLNNLNLSSTINYNNIWQTIFYSDPLFRGNSTYTITSINLYNIIEQKTLSGTDWSFTLPDTYFYYTLNDVTIEDNDTTVKITLGSQTQL